jgi:hypothetical protein
MAAAASSSSTTSNAPTTATTTTAGEGLVGGSWRHDDIIFEFSAGGVLKMLTGMHAPSYPSSIYSSYCTTHSYHILTGCDGWVGGVVGGLTTAPYTSIDGMLDYEMSAGFAGQPEVFQGHYEIDNKDGKKLHIWIPAEPLPFRPPRDACEHVILKQGPAISKGSFLTSYLCHSLS